MNLMNNQLVLIAQVPQKYKYNTILGMVKD